MTKKIENFIDNVIEEKKEQFKTMMGKEHKVENMIKDLKSLNLSNEKLEEVIKVAKKQKISQIMLQKKRKNNLKQ